MAFRNRFPQEVQLKSAYIRAVETTRQGMLASIGREGEPKMGAPLLDKEGAPVKLKNLGDEELLGLKQYYARCAVVHEDIAPYWMARSELYELEYIRQQDGWSFINALQTGIQVLRQKLDVNNYVHKAIACNNADICREEIFVRAHPESKLQLNG